MCARCSWSQVSVFQHYRNLLLTSSLSQLLYAYTQPYHPFCSNLPPPPPPPPPPPTHTHTHTHTPTTLCQWSASHPDYWTMGSISSRWFNYWQYLIGMTYGHCHLPSGWLSWSWNLIRMSYDNVIMSPGWHALPFLSHPDDIANFDFSQHTVAPERSPHHRTCLNVAHIDATTNNTKVF